MGDSERKIIINYVFGSIIPILGDIIWSQAILYHTALIQKGKQDVKNVV